MPAPLGAGVVGLHVPDQVGLRLLAGFAGAQQALPRLGRRDEVTEAEHRGLAGGAGDLEGTAVVAGRPAALAGAAPRPVGPGVRPPRGDEFRRDVPAVVNELEHRPHRARRLARDDRLRVAAARPDIAAGDRHGLARQSDEPLDVVGLGLLGILEDDDVPPRRRGDVVRELVDEDAVAVERRVVRVGDAIDATRDREGRDPAAVGTGGPRHELRAELAAHERRAGGVTVVGLEACELGLQSARLLVVLAAAADAEGQRA